MSNIKHLKCLSAVKSMSSIRHLTPAAFPGNHCPMHTALSVGSRIRGISTLVIGTAECGYYSRNVPLASLYADEGFHWVYVLDSKEVVFGCRDGLIKAIREMDKAGARVILLLATCVPELIGEDIDGICRELQPQIHARLVHSPLGNFKCGSYQPGYWKTLLALGEMTEKTSRKSKTVNILGRSALEEHISKPQLIAALERKTVALRHLAPDSGLEDFIQAGDAQINLVFSPFLAPLAQRMEQEHDIPFFSLHDIYDVCEIKAIYERISRHLEIELGLEFAEQYEETALFQERIKSKAAGAQYIGAQVGAVQPLPVSAYLSALGMSPIMVHMEEFYPSDAYWRDRIVGMGGNPLICLMANERADKGVDIFSW
ncbi:MAG: nitrogenase component 1 [Gracilibacteraceae bacterium]|nr:nitrogenase component 1 [Gracilibacteraceae bacterium]